MNIAIGFILLLVIITMVAVRQVRKAARANREAVRASEDQLVAMLENMCAKKDALHSARAREQMSGKLRRPEP